ncbi:endonuclease/exonuclease/phosphatase family protein [Streptacidiphilus sp. EB103A]|uniref:endonuclease/exonuclease/phosphatase family protein n=1 Tax=Streptacidiphilus sp. EB103A TaxID=3156275 RepID=UPI003512EEF3
MTWNVQHASAERSQRQVAWLAGQPGADVVVLTEVGHGPGGEGLLAALAEHGYTAVLSRSPDEATYRAVIASRIGELTEIPTGIEVLAHRALAASVDLGGQRIAVAGLYVPSRGPKERRNLDKRAFQDAVAAALPALVARFDGPWVVAGDMNVLEPGHKPHYPLFGAWEYDFYAAFGRVGLVDAFRALHPGVVEHSWFGHGGNGYRFDHAYVSANVTHRVLTCEYLHEPREAGLSDHAALTLTLSLPAPRPPSAPT